MTRFWGAFSAGKTLGVWNVFWAAQNFDRIRYDELTWMADMARASGQGREAKALKEQAKRESELYAGGLKCLLVNSESRPDPLYLERLGIRTDKDSFEIAPSTRIEKIGDIVTEALPAYHVIAVDSTTNTMSLDELADPDGIFNSKLPLLRVQKWGRNFDWWSDRISDDNVLIFTSQIQAKIGMSAAQRIEGEHPPGGKKMEHDASLVLHFMKGKWLKRKPDGGLVEMGDKGGEKGAFGKSQAAGSEVVVRCDKNKYGSQGRVVLMHHDKLIPNWDPLHELEKFCKFFKVIPVAGGGWVTLPSGESRACATRSSRTTACVA
jgi:RecA/RadA recombinase